MTCGKIFKTYPSKIALGKGKYCSQQCQFKSMAYPHISSDFFYKGMTPWNKGLKGAQVAWNKGSKGIIKVNKGSFQNGEMGSQVFV